MRCTEKQIRLANALHSLLCNNNHTDGCGWYYEENWYIDQKKPKHPGGSINNIWKEPSHSHWMCMAKKLNKYFSLEEIQKAEYAVKVINTFNNLVYKLGK